QRARIVGSGPTARLLAHAIAARAAAETEWIPEREEAEVPGVRMLTREAAGAEEAARAPIDLLGIATLKSSAIEAMAWVSNSLEGLLIAVSDSLVDARAVGSLVTGLAPEVPSTAARPFLAPRLAAEESPDEAFVGRPVAIAAAARVTDAVLAAAERF